MKPLNKVGGQRLTTKTMSSNKSIFLILISTILILYTGCHIYASADEDAAGLELDSLDSAQETSETNNIPNLDSNPKDKDYVSPKLKPDGTYLYENFDDEQQFNINWVPSKDPKYADGKWELSSGPDRPRADRQLVLPRKARHYAISSKLNEPFKFGEDKPLIVQYEVQFRETLDCGGAYVKLLRHSAISDLNKLTDKTPFTIMFGPDKCGSEAKLHFIIQYFNPKTQEFVEKHWKQAKYVPHLTGIFSDKAHHIIKFVLEPNNKFEIFLDDRSVGKGNLLEDLDPPINPPKEIVDPNDTKPSDWVDDAEIDDPEAKKPEDWDDNAPKMIEDPDDSKPSDWLDEPKLIPDPDAKKPDDWEDMDGEWGAPLIDNPKCAKAAGCGEWKPKMIPNPNFKGKWKPPRIPNPKFVGKWAPRMIPNPDYYYDEKPFLSLEPIGAIAYELWSMADNIAFDNLIITSAPESASVLQHLTWQDKKAEADSVSPSLLTRATHYLKVHPWLWAVIVLAIALPLFLFISYCCDTKRSRGASRATTEESARRKKEDESRPDATVDEGEEANTGDEEEVGNEEEDDEEEDADEEDEKPAGDRISTRPVRQRKKN